MITELSWKLLLDNIHDHECVPFLGAAASMGFDGVPGLPTAGEIAESLSQYVQYPGADKYDFLRVCQFYELATGNKSKLRKEIAKQLRVPGVRPGVVHKSIAALPFNFVLTTNYDDLMERAFRDEGKQPAVEVYDLRGNASAVQVPSTLKPLVYKLHGTLERETTMICTEDDVVRFLAALINGVPPLPDTIKHIFQENSFLFIGYGLKDWNIRVLLRALRHGKEGADAWVKSYAVQRRPADKVDLQAEWDASVLYWDKLENVLCFDVDAAEFINELAVRYKARYP